MRFRLVQFIPGQRKAIVMAEHLRRCAGEEGVVFIGKAQENTAVFRTATDPENRSALSPPPKST